MNKTGFGDSALGAVPFTSKEYFISSHCTRYDRIDFVITLKALGRFLFSIFGSFGKAHVCAAEIIYHGGRKTRKEYAYFLRYFNCASGFTDRSLADVGDVPFQRRSLLCFFYKAHFRKIFMQLLRDKELSTGLKCFLLSDLTWNYGYYDFLLVNASSAKRVISFFSTTTAAYILREFCRNNGGQFIYYAWGSNLGADEFRYSGADVSLLKNDNDMRVFNMPSYGEIHLIGDVSLNVRLSSRFVVNPGKLKILVIDICIGKRFSLDQKRAAYKSIVAYFSNLDVEIFVRPHPATPAGELMSICSELCLVPLLGAHSFVDPIEQAAQYDICVNLGSTLKDGLVLSGYPVVDFYYHCFSTSEEESFEEASVFPGHIYKEGDLCAIGDVLYSPEKVRPYCLSQGLREVDDNQVGKILNG